MADATFSLGGGECLAVFGLNGAGKTPRRAGALTMPDTFNVMAYVAAGVLCAGYAASLLVRHRKLSPRAKNQEPRTES